MTYVSYLRAIMRDLADELPTEALCNLDRDLLSHIGGGWRNHCDPEAIVALIISDWNVPPVRVSVSEARA